MRVLIKMGEIELKKNKTKKERNKERIFFGGMKLKMIKH